MTGDRPEPGRTWTVTLEPGGYVTLPAEVIAALGWREGDRLRVGVEEGRLWFERTDADGEQQGAVPGEPGVGR